MSDDPAQLTTDAADVERSAVPVDSSSTQTLPGPIEGSLRPPSPIPSASSDAGTGTGYDTAHSQAGGRALDERAASNGSSGRSTAVQSEAGDVEVSQAAPERVFALSAEDNPIFAAAPSSSSTPTPAAPGTPASPKTARAARIATLLHTSDGLVPASAPTSPTLSRKPALPALTPASSSKPVEPSVPVPSAAPKERVQSPSRAANGQRNVAFDPLSSTQTTPRRPKDVANAIGIGRKKPSLEDTLEDLRSLLRHLRRILPLGGRVTRYLPRLVVNIARSFVRHFAKMLHQRNLLASNVAYDLCLLLLKWIINLFFREIRPRGAHKIPKDGALIFVAAPHHNQFLDPILLMSEVRTAASSRRISFLVAEKSMKRAFIGFMARVMQSISVVRANDNAKPGPGKLYLSPGDSTDTAIVRGVGTSFTSDLKPKKQLMLPKSLGFVTAEVVEVIGDDQVKVKKPFSSKASEALIEQGKKFEGGDKEAGVDYKILPYIDQTLMYGKVYEQMKEGGCLGIFPEGGSHDRTDLLPLKAGVSIMALGAMSANHDVRVKIVPVGMSYFHAHRFRSRAVVEFGTPIEIPQELVRDFEKGNEDKKRAIGKVMDLVYDGLKSVTLRAPDYETLQVVQAARRLYRPPHRQVSLGQVVELNKRFIKGYLEYEKEPRVQELRARVLEYNRQLRYLGIKDHQVERGNRPWWKALILLLFRAGLVTGWTVLALPGVILNAPMFIAASYISRQKAKEALAASTVKIAGRDVLATWKVLVSLGMAPPLYLSYIVIAVATAYRHDLVPRKYLPWMPLALIIALPSIGYSALKFGEVGMDVYKSLRPLFLSLTGNQKQIERLQKMRQDLSAELNSVIDEYAPQIWEDFDRNRVIAPTSSAPASPETSHRRKSSYEQNDLLNHPLAWLDERLFGWSQYDKRSRPTNGADSDATSAPPSGYTSEEEEGDGDFDSVIGQLGTVMGMEKGTSRSRRSSRSARSKSRTNLADLGKVATEADSAKSTAVSLEKGGRSGGP